LGHILCSEVGCMNWVDPDCELKGRHEGCGGEVEGDHEPILRIRNKCLGSSDACELTVDINCKQAITYRATCS
jgi:hypothetical protein